MAVRGGLTSAGYLAEWRESGLGGIWCSCNPDPRHLGCCSKSKGFRGRSFPLTRARSLLSTALWRKPRKHKLQESTKGFLVKKQPPDTFAVSTVNFILQPVGFSVQGQTSSTASVRCCSNTANTSSASVHPLATQKIAEFLQPTTGSTLGSCGFVVSVDRLAAAGDETEITWLILHGRLNNEANDLRRFPCCGGTRWGGLKRRGGNRRLC